MKIIDFISIKCYYLYGERMKKGFTIIDFIIILTIISIIGVFTIIIVNMVINNLKEEGNKILIDNFANEILYTKEVYMKNNDNNIPIYCNKTKDLIYYDENYNDKYDSNELLCNKDCDNDTCIKHFITNDNLNNKDIKCNKIIINDKSIEISNCYIKNKEIKYQYKLENSVE